MEENEVSSEQTGDTTVAEESAPQAEPVVAETQASAPEKEPEEKPAPFHEHPRFKELIEQNRGYKSELEQAKELLGRFQRELDTVKQAVPKKEEPKDPFLADLEKVNPAYAKSLQAMYEQAGLAKTLKSELDQMKQQQFAEKAYSHFDKLLSDNKVTDDLGRDVYRSAVEAEVYRREQRGEKLGLKDLDTIFNQFHAKYAKAMEERDRKITASYVTAKKKDTAPTTQTGGGAVSSTPKKLAANDFAGQAKWLAQQIRDMKKEH